MMAVLMAAANWFESCCGEVLQLHSLQPMGMPAAPLVVLVLFRSVPALCRADSAEAQGSSAAQSYPT